MNIEEREALCFQLEGERNDIIEQIKALYVKRDCLKFGEKKESKAIMHEIHALDRRRQRLRPQIQAARFEFERAERHGLWETAVRTLWGADGLAACRAQMRQLKINREAAE